MSLKLTAKNFIIQGIEHDMDIARRRIRQGKKELKIIESMRAEIRNKTENEVLDMIQEEPELVEEFMKMVKKAEEHNAEISENIKKRFGLFEGKLSEKQAESLKKAGITVSDKVVEKSVDAKPEGVCT